MINTCNVIGSGFSGLSVAAHLSSSVKNINVFEKNNHFGGRARQIVKDGFVFDMGPSWYWMPDVFERFFNKFGKQPSDYYDLVKLDPGFQIIFEHNHSMKIPQKWSEILNLFEKYEKGSSKNLVKFMEDAMYKYNVGMTSLVYQSGMSIFELFRIDILKNIFKMNLFSSYRRHVYRYFKNPYLRSLLEFPVLFLGASPSETPALYSLMGYSALKQGTYYPIGGFGKVIDGMMSLCKELGVSFYNNHEIIKCNFDSNNVSSLVSNKGEHKCDYTVCSSDYQHFDQKILPSRFKHYSRKYWDKRLMSPSSLLFYIGVNKKIDKLEHHNLFFDEDIEQHTIDIYTDIKWPEKPLFYVCCPSKTDKSVAPPSYENIFILMPIAAGINDNKSIREKYFEIIIKRIEKYAQTTIKDNILFKDSYCVNDFKSDYNAFKGNAYGMANTLFQTANFKPKIKNKHLNNLFYTGQLTVPGPGVPPSIISGDVVANYIIENHKK